MKTDITQLLASIKGDDRRVREELLPLVYAELRAMAARRIANEAPGHTLQPTALVHEAWLRLVGENQRTWQNRAHFFGAAAEAMRRILVDCARRKATERRGGRLAKLDFDHVDAAVEADEQVLALHEALERFAQVEPQKAELVKLRYFGGLTFEDAAGVLTISVPTAKRWWAYARAWLYAEITQ